MLILLNLKMNDITASITGFPITAQTNVKKAHEYLFGTKDYKPTEELQKNQCED